MIVDTSAIIAILRDEPEGEQFVVALSKAKGNIRMSAASLVEVGMVAGAAKSPEVLDQVKDLIRNFEIQIGSVNEATAWQAIEAHRTFGKGSGHPARLNFGDCFSYALAKAENEPLLFKGDDFAQTDIGSVLPEG
jgi:ribonuclease VapC